jgi:hypothetical protein
MSIVCHMRYTLPFLLILAACADIPALDGTLSDTARLAPYPRLAPLEDLPAPVMTEADGMENRLAALQRRAATLRAIDPDALQ